MWFPLAFHTNISQCPLTACASTEAANAKVVKVFMVVACAEEQGSQEGPAKTDDRNILGRFSTILSVPRTEEQEPLAKGALVFHG